MIYKKQYFNTRYITAFYHCKLLFDRCGSCKDFAPIWDELATKYNADPEKSQVILAKVYKYKCSYRKIILEM